MHSPKDAAADLTEGDVNLSPNRRLWTARLGERTRSLLARDAAVFLHQSLSTPCLDALAACRDSRLTDLDGRDFLDFHGNSVHQVGFSRPEVIQAVADQMRALSFSPRRFTNEPAVQLAERIVKLSPEPLGKILFAPGGALAVGMAMKIARVATGRFKTVSMWDSFHGASLDAVSVGGEALFRAGIGPLLPGTEHVPPADPYRCVLAPAAGGCDACGLRCAAYLEYVLDQEKDVAAVIAEPFRCTTVNLPPKGYWQRVRQACDRRGTLLVMDETALCLGRAGSFHAFERFGIVPDMVVMGKGLGGGIMPLACVVARRDLDVAGHLALGHYTHEKNPVACAAALAAIDVVLDEGLPERAMKLGAYAVARLQDMALRTPLMGEVRGLGLSMAVELVTDREAKTPAVAEAEAVLYRCLERGLSFKVSHGNCLTLTPPLTISREDLDTALCILDEALASPGA
ncbi:aspartate aminotransferase family protein [Solidesulfovibrio sp.]|uniref:(R)-1-hydroxy-2-aminoethylphosphonate ammonia-lyase n=1 Tax=Solidesulfovibrio sp. TaxID=2910990 RepID=UPI000EEC1AF8|nr:aspartate aminotransferase family protein [Solidesulfovibrio sp.]MEA5090453.1 aspartate aminotransferase family protein [Solidesulfovibrio sp.]HCR13611.1 aspartate aminotransferase family protein [Desulfovibrio sp.]HML60437.1 aspartate aminotransferase family protein [Solidesulfovibrio sp.]